MYVKYFLKLDKELAVFVKLLTQSIFFKFFLFYKSQLTLTPFSRLVIAVN